MAVLTPIATLLLIVLSPAISLDRKSVMVIHYIALPSDIYQNFFIVLIFVTSLWSCNTFFIAFDVDWRLSIKFNSSI